MISKQWKHNSAAAIALALCMTAGASVAADDPVKSATVEEFPTVAIADYVLGCMAANGNTADSLYKCSCSIDYIKSKVTYEEYERAQTVMTVKLDRGQRGIFFRESTWAKNAVALLERVQAESTLRCF